MTKIFCNIFGHSLTQWKRDKHNKCIEKRGCRFCKGAEETVERHNWKFEFLNAASTHRKKTCESCGKIVFHKIKETQEIITCSFCNGFGLWHPPTDGYLSGNTMSGHQDDCPHCDGKGQREETERKWVLIEGKETLL